jgi:hypothetical protein
MKLAILLLCHKNAEQINMFLDTMKHPDIEFFIHIDKKADITSQIIKRPDVYILPDNLRIDVQWGEFSQSQATLNLMRFAWQHSKVDYYWLCSGQDFPIHTPAYILDYIEKRKGNNFIQFWKSAHNGISHETNLDKRNIIYYPHWMMGRSLKKRVVKRLYVCLTGGYNRTFTVWRRRDQFSTIDSYFGPNWMCLTESFLSWVWDYLQENPWYEKHLHHSTNPDECFFQTLLMLSPYRENKYDYLHYIDWSDREGKPQNSPNLLTINDYDKLMMSKYLMARKFDIKSDRAIIDKLRDSLKAK